MIEVILNNETFKINAKNYECSPLFEEIGDTVITQDGTEHVENGVLKRVLNIEFTDMKRADMYRLMQCLNQVMKVTYFDTISNQTETRVFVLQNSPSAKMKIWKGKLEYYQGTTLELKEKGATGLL